VANAGIGLYGGIEDTSDDDLTRMIEVNFSGTVWSVRAAVPQLRRQGDGGDLVLVSSVAGLRGGADEAVYAGTKFAQVGLAGSLDRELREDAEGTTNREVAAALGVWPQTVNRAVGRRDHERQPVP
jgi:NAD(P)-dependent dehydrogenase (short-subunit alcohol dehydrogenase family)